MKICLDAGHYGTAIMRVYPTGTAFHDKIYHKTKVSGSCLSWYQFAGERV